MKINEINVLALAYLGDSVYEIYIREYLIKSGITKANELQKASLNYVSAKSQARILEKLCQENIFTIDELDLIKRARNNHSKNHPKNCSIITYKYATALEALFGYLKLLKNEQRIEEIINKIIY